MLRQRSYAIKNQLVAKIPPTRGISCSSLVLYGIRIVGFHAWKGPIIDCQWECWIYVSSITLQHGAGQSRQRNYLTVVLFWGFGRRWKLPVTNLFSLSWLISRTKSGSPSKHLFSLGGITSPEDLYQYIEKSEAGFQCTICCKIFTRRYEGRSHVESVHFPNYFEYQCEFCGASFKSKKTYFNHKQYSHRS